MRAKLSSRSTASPRNAAQAVKSPKHKAEPRSPSSSKQVMPSPTKQVFKSITANVKPPSAPASASKGVVLPSREPIDTFVSYSPFDYRFPPYKTVSRPVSPTMANRTPRPASPLNAAKTPRAAAATVATPRTTAVAKSITSVKPPSAPLSASKFVTMPSRETAPSFQTFSPFDSRFPSFKPSSKPVSPTAASSPLKRPLSPTAAAQRPASPTAKATIPSVPRIRHNSPKRINTAKKSSPAAPSSMPSTPSGISIRKMHVLITGGVKPPCAPLSASKGIVMPSKEKAADFTTYSPFDLRFPPYKSLSRPGSPTSKASSPSARMMLPASTPRAVTKVAQKQMMTPAGKGTKQQKRLLKEHVHHVPRKQGDVRKIKMRGFQSVSPFDQDFARLCGLPTSHPHHKGAHHAKSHHASTNRQQGHRSGGIQKTPVSTKQSPARVGPTATAFPRVSPMAKTPQVQAPTFFPTTATCATNTAKGTGVSLQANRRM